MDIENDTENAFLALRWKHKIEVVFYFQQKNCVILTDVENSVDPITAAKQIRILRTGQSAILVFKHCNRFNWVSTTACWLIQSVSYTSIIVVVGPTVCNAWCWGEVPLKANESVRETTEAAEMYWCIFGEEREREKIVEKFSWKVMFMFKSTPTDLSWRF